MTSTGNDIVALSAINITRTKQPRFYTKILNDTEIALYKSSAISVIPLENYVWLLWSIKESAYKYLQRITPGLVFSPTKIIIKQLKLPFGFIVTNFNNKQKESTGFDDKIAYKAVISFGSDILYSRSLIYNELIFSTVNINDDFSNTHWGIKVIDNPEPQFQSTAVREFLLNKLSGLFEADNIRIDKSPEGIPFLLKGTGPIDIPISLAHHDCFVGYSFQV
jgi:phosphopantetheinyl transferase (holo-ACP synthase)